MRHIDCVGRTLLSAAFEFDFRLSTNCAFVARQRNQKILTKKSTSKGRTRVSAPRGLISYCLSYTTISWKGLPSLSVPSIVKVVVLPSSDRTDLLFAALPFMFQVCSLV